MAYSPWPGSVRLSSSLKVLRQTTIGLTYLMVSLWFHYGGWETDNCTGSRRSAFHLVLLFHFVISTPRDMLP